MELLAKVLIMLGEPLWAANPERVDSGDGLARAYYNLGVLLRTTGRRLEAMKAFQRSSKIDDGKVMFEMLRTEWRRKLQPLLNVLGWPRRWLNAIRNKFRKAP